MARIKWHSVNPDSVMVFASIQPHGVAGIEVALRIIRKAGDYLHLMSARGQPGSQAATLDIATGSGSKNCVSRRIRIISSGQERSDEQSPVRFRCIARAEPTSRQVGCRC